MVTLDLSYTSFFVCVSPFQFSRPRGEIGSTIKDGSDFGKIIFNGDKLIPHNNPRQNNDKAASANEGT